MLTQCPMSDNTVKSHAQLDHFSTAKASHTTEVRDKSEDGDGHGQLVKHETVCRTTTGIY